MNMFDIFNNNLAFITNIRGSQLLIIALVILLLFGTKRLPEMARGFGKALKEFKKSASNAEKDFRDAMDSEESAAQPAKEVATTATEPTEAETKKSA